ncbi:MAG: glycosyltransferase [Bacteroidetes bacterium]|nr:glycosyltransferase [Bacteroidota bacterium]
MEINYKKIKQYNFTNRVEYFNAIAPFWDYWKGKNTYYHRCLQRMIQFLVEPRSVVLELGCATGDLLAACSPEVGVGLDVSEKMIDIARQKYPHMEFHCANAENFTIDKKFDYVLMVDLIGHLKDIQITLAQARRVMHPHTRLIITYYNFLWEPILTLAEKLHLKTPQPRQNWINTNDILNLLEIADYEVIRTGQFLLIPKYIPILSWLFNKYIAHLPFFKKLCVSRYIVARPRFTYDRSMDLSVSIIVPARNERGNIERIVSRLPELGKHTEIIFVEGHSTDGTWEEILRVKELYGSIRDIKAYHQRGTGKGDAVREGFRYANGDVLMIYDADVTVAPDDLQKFFYLIATNHGEFINGSRLVYPMEKEAMRFLNLLGNKFFSLLFTWLIGQRFKDTLCGTKVLLRKDYERIAKNRTYFGEFDPFGDFDLIFGAAKLNLKIVEVPVRYYERTYGTTNISRFKHGWLLFRMSLFAMNKLKFVL